MTPDNHRLHLKSADEAAVLVVIVTTIAEHNVGTASGSTALASHRGHVAVSDVEHAAFVRFDRRRQARHGGVFFR
ncbi:hypothetical protein [Streptomyces atratus]|uniref:hypothetical protein n=1 Tax=Streptomyces atratus TaxID=1893 RepID=UPI0013009FBA|nr:hypothetical protein [Streptomyces atratus]